MAEITGADSIGGINQNPNDSLTDGKFWFEWYELPDTQNYSDLTEIGFDTVTGDYIGTGQLWNSGTTDNLDIPSRADTLGESDSAFGVRVTFTYTPTESGSYTFYLYSDDGSRMYVDGTQVVELDGLHAPQDQDGTTTIQLEAGQPYTVTIITFENTGVQALDAGVLSGPGMGKTSFNAMDEVSANAGDDVVSTGQGDDRVDGGLGNDQIDGGAGNDTLSGGPGDDTLTGGDGWDTFIVTPATSADDATLITDFNAGADQDFSDGDQSNNDFVDLSQFYTQDALDAWNAAHPDQKYNNPLAWMRADQADDGVLNQPEGLNLTLQNGGAPVAGSDLTWDNTNVVCFAADVLIQTDRGQVRAGDLQVGDLVLTRDAGLQPVRWTGRRAYTRTELEAAPLIRPIRIMRGALGNGLPTADLLVSPQHRVLVRSAIAQKMFGTDEVLVAAKQLLLLDGIDVASPDQGVTYVHFLFDAHQIVFSNGAETESLYTGAEALRSVGQAARDEILGIFPELRDRPDAPVSARMLASGRMGRKLAVRHANNRKPLVR